MYGQILADIDVFTANLPGPVPSGQIANQIGSREHYYIDLDTDNLCERYPVLSENPFDIILLCEVIEHLRASPDEVFSDLMKILAPGGVLVVSTPNAMSARTLLQLAIGRKADFVYKKRQRKFHDEHHAHVREFTTTEIRDALVSSGATVLMLAAKNYYSELRQNLVATKYVSAREAQIALATRPRTK